VPINEECPGAKHLGYYEKNLSAVMPFAGHCKFDLLIIKLYQINMNKI
jgi:hypothetical protein